MSVSGEFWSLHTHSHYSKGDALPDPYEYQLRAAELDQPALGITDHGSMVGLLLHQMGNGILSRKDPRKAILPKRKVLPVHGCEWYVVDDANEKTRSRYHLITVAKNWEGYKAMVKMSRYGFKHHHHRPLIDRKLLQEMADAGLTKHLVATTACPLSHVAMAIAWEGMEEAIKELEWYKSIFPDFYVELMDHDTEDEEFGEGSLGDIKRNNLLIDLARGTDTPLVITNDVHYLEDQDYYFHHGLLCCASGKNMKQREGYSGTGYHLKSEQEMYEQFKKYGDPVWDESLGSLTKIREQCSDFKSPTFFDGSEPVKWHLPTVSDGDPDEELIRMTNEGLKRRVAWRAKGEEYQRYVEQAKYELGIFIRTGFSTYFNMLQDWVNWCKTGAPCEICRDRGDGEIANKDHDDKDHPYMGILTGPCRGSAGGSLVLYLLGATDIDPIRYGLSFDRFIDEERLKYDVPDVDVDVQADRRYEVIQYLRDKYGEENVAQISTTLIRQAPSACNDACMALGIPLHESKVLSNWLTNNQLGSWGHGALIKMFNREGTTEKVEEILDKYPHLEPMAMKLGMTLRSYGKHAAGVVIADDGVLQSMDPQIYAGGDVVSAYIYSHHGFLGLVKNDILGLSNLTAIQRCRRLVWDRQKHDIMDDINRIMDYDEFNDSKVYNLIQKGDTQGVFQFEGGAFPSVCKQVKPDQFSDLADINALVRPSTGRYLPQYIEYKSQGGKKFDHERLNDIVGRTYGVLMYEDQVLRIAKEIAGVSGKGLYKLKKATKFASEDMMMEVKPEFIEGMLKANFTEDEAEDWWSQVLSLGSYGFNASHSHGYSMIGYWTAYLMENYPVEYAAALLNTTGEVKRYAPILARHRIKVMPPDINESGMNFTPVSDDVIRYGLSNIAGVSQKGFELLRSRIDEKPFESMEDFEAWYKSVAKRNLNGTAIRNLKLVGAMDSIGCQVNYEELGYHKKESLCVADRAEAELKLMGRYVTHDPIGEDQIFIDKMVMSSPNIDKLEGDESVDGVWVGGLITELREHKQKNGQMMAFVTIEASPDHKWGVTLFASTYAKDYNKDALANNGVVLMRGKWQPDRGSLLAHKITTATRIREKIMENDHAEV